MAASHHHQQHHHMNNIHRSSTTTANTACAMIEDEEEDLAALRNAALKTLEEQKLKKEPRALIVQRNNVLVIEPQDSVHDYHRSPIGRRRSRDRSPSPVCTHRRRSRDRSPSPRRISPPSSRWSPRNNAHRGSPPPPPLLPQYHANGGRHSPPHHSWNTSKRRSSPRSHSPRRLSHSPRRRSPVRRRSPPSSRRSPHRMPPSPGRRSPRKSPMRSPVRRSPPQFVDHRRSSPIRRSPRKSPMRSPVRRSSPLPPPPPPIVDHRRSSPSLRKSPRKSPARNSPRRFSPRRRLRDTADSRTKEASRRNGVKRRNASSPPSGPALPPSSSSLSSQQQQQQQLPVSSSSSSSLSGRRKTISPRRRGAPQSPVAVKSAAEETQQTSTKKGRFERFEDSAASDDESCNESLLDELFKETEETSARTEALDSDSHDEDSKENAGLAADHAGDDKAEDEDCLMLQADDDMDDLLVDSSVTESATSAVSQPLEKPIETDSRQREQGKVFKERDHDEKNRIRRHSSDRRTNDAAVADADARGRSRNAQSERTARIDKKENRERPSKVSKIDSKASLRGDNGSEKRKRSRSRDKDKDKDKGKRKSSRKTSPKAERHSSNSKVESRSHSTSSHKSRTHTSPEKSISNEDRERLEARKKKFLQKELKPLQKVISLKKSPLNKLEETEETRRVQDRLGVPVKETRRSSPGVDGADAVEVPSKPTILSRLGPPPTSRGTIKDRIGFINTNSSSSPTRAPQAGVDSAQVKFEVRNRPTLDPKLKIHINLGGSLSTGSNSGNSKSKKVVCLD